MSWDISSSEPSSTLGLLLPSEWNPIIPLPAMLAVEEACMLVRVPRFPLTDRSRGPSAVEIAPRSLWWTPLTLGAMETWVDWGYIPLCIAMLEARLVYCNKQSRGKNYVLLLSLSLLFLFSFSLSPLSLSLSLSLSLFLSLSLYTP